MRPDINLPAGHRRPVLQELLKAHPALTLSPGAGAEGNAQAFLFGSMVFSLLQYPTIPWDEFLFEFSHFLSHPHSGSKHSDFLYLKSCGISQ
jgi:hypothetical protein